MISTKHEPFNFPLKADFYNDSRKFGVCAESIVAKILADQGVCVIAHNYRSSRGEIDIIATHDNLLVFIEVKARMKQTFDIGAVITAQKQRKIIYTAQHFLHHNPQLEEKMCRFDVVLIEQLIPYPTITYIPDAFDASQ